MHYLFCQMEQLMLRRRQRAAFLKHDTLKLANMRRS
nr:MAG TPA: hypothetical protein [Caudoviricetes sp.]